MRRALSWAALALGLLALHALLAAGRPAVTSLLGPEPVEAEGAIEPCAAVDPTRWGIGDPPADGRFAFHHNGMVYLRVCAPGSLVLELDGRPAGGRGALVVVAQGKARLAQLEVDGPQVVELTVPEPGWIVVAFVNRVVAADGRRSLWIERIAFASPSP